MIVVPFKHGHKLAYTQVNEHVFKRSPPNVFAQYWLCMSTTPPIKSQILDIAQIPFQQNTTMQRNTISLSSTEWYKATTLSDYDCISENNRAFLFISLLVD